MKQLNTFFVRSGNNKRFPERLSVILSLSVFYGIRIGPKIGP
ncbi:hypothetical protein HanPSC8_Chr16g0723171 [Helianthus annuus]|nr:hypothetical protein HanPSC8_Chr16g0723171 [Helianthus annuus]